MTGPRRVHLLGAGGHAKVVLQTLRAMGHTVAMIFDDDAAHWGKTLLGVSVAGPIDRVEEHAALPAVIAIGDNARRKAVASRLNLEWMTVVHPRAHVDATVRLGAGTVILVGAVIQPDTVVGDHVIVNTSASVDHDCAIGDFAHLAPGTRLAGDVTVGEGALLGIGAVVIPGIRIGDWTTVGAGAAVVRDLPPGVVAMGVPAEVARQALPRPGVP
ncbi:MAG: acetyltransferase [Planctomycetia bacterium]|nr:acetyltransferase [Planctomycetia bacterium]